MDEPSPFAVGRRTFLASVVLLASGQRRATAQGVRAPETWFLEASAGDQAHLLDPGMTITAALIDDAGRVLAPARDLAGILARCAGRPIVVTIHGNNYTREDALKEGVQIRAQLSSAAGFNPDTIFLVVHWPSERGAGLIRDLNEKTRQSQLMGFRVARLLQQFPPQARITLLGQSNGARIILSAVHLLHGQPLEGYPGIPEFRLSASRADLRFRLVLLEAAVGHNWLRLGARLDGVVPASEAILNLYNRCDLALAAYPYGRYTGGRQALGRVGLTPHDLARLGPLSGRIAQYEIHAAFGPRHVLFPEICRVPEILGVVANYTRW